MMDIPRAFSIWGNNSIFSFRIFYLLLSEFMEISFSVNDSDGTLIVIKISLYLYSNEPFWEGVEHVHSRFKIKLTK